MLRRASQGKYLSRTPDALLRLTVAYLLGLHHVNFTLLWKDAKDALAAFARYRPMLLWQIFEARYMRVLHASEEMAEVMEAQARAVAKQQLNDTLLRVFDDKLDVLGYRCLVHRHEQRIGLLQRPDLESSMTKVGDRVMEAVCPQPRVDVMQLLRVFAQLACTWPQLTERKHRSGKCQQV